MYELWYKHTIRNLSLTIGLQDMNSNFAITENGTLFTNSSFGIHPSIADNIPSPIFPLTALGATMKWNNPGKFVLEAAVFDGSPDDFENNPYNNYYLSIGLNIKGIGSKRPDDHAGMAIALAGFGEGLMRNETVIELTYLISVNENVRFKPDLQYIIHPAGTGVNLLNAFVASARMELNF